jgi:hypothetical protein
VDAVGGCASMTILHFQAVMAILLVVTIAGKGASFNSHKNFLNNNIILKEQPLPST